MVDTLPIRHNGLVATPTLVGWIISGSLSATHSNSETVSKLFPTTCLNISEVQVTSWWDLEAVGVRPDDAHDSEDPVLIQFYQQLEYSNSLQAYRVSLPWRSLVARASIGDNFYSALKRLQDLHRRLFNKNKELEVKYYHIFQMYFNTGIAEFIPPSEILPYHQYPYPIFYLPHRPVIKPGSSSPVRPVFDGSASTDTGYSLNDAVSQGPSLFPDMVQVLLRFRRHPVALSGDICMAFLNIHVNPVDQNVQVFIIH